MPARPVRLRTALSVAADPRRGCVSYSAAMVLASCSAARSGFSPGMLVVGLPNTSGELNGRPALRRMNGRALALGKVSRVYCWSRYWPVSGFNSAAKGR